MSTVEADNNMADLREDDDDDEEMRRMQEEIQKREKEAKELAEIANAVSGTHPATLGSSSTGGASGAAGEAGEGGEAGEEAAIDSREEVDSRSVFVGNVDFAATPEEIQQYFQACGAINRVTILCDKFTGHPKGYAYVEFAEASSVANAVVLNESSFRGRQIQVNAKRTNTPAFQRGGGRGRGRGRGGYRGGYRARGGFSPYGRGRGRGRGGY